MKHKSLIIPIIFLTFFAGITRHDVDESKYLKLAAEKQFDCVGQIFKGTSSSGSCVLIGDRYVISAAHVFIDNDTRPDTFSVGGQTIIAYVPFNQRLTDTSELNVVFKSNKTGVKRLLLHPKYLDSISKGTCDIAILELENPIYNVLPIKINTAFDELNSKVVGVGFGASGQANRPELVAVLNKKIAGENVIDSIAGIEYLRNKTLLMCDFDHPTRSDCNKMGSPIPRPLEYTASGGDSGGGLFRKNKGQWELIGICSGIDNDIKQFMNVGYYGQIMEWTRVSVFAKWIDEQINK